MVLRLVSKPCNHKSVYCILYITSIVCLTTLNYRKDLHVENLEMVTISAVILIVYSFQVMTHTQLDWKAVRLHLKTGISPYCLNIKRSKIISMLTVMTYFYNSSKRSVSHKNSMKSFLLLVGLHSKRLTNYFAISCNLGMAILWIV